MVKKLLTGNAAAAWGARLADVDYVPAFPITPQTEIIETLSGWFDGGQMRGKFVTLDSEHSMVTAAGAAAATGVRTFTATSSQGLLYALEALYSIAGWRVPLVLVNVSRGIASPVTLGPDHNYVLAARDTGFAQIHCETCQEVLDSILMAFRIAEDPRVSIPVLVNLDGFFLSFTREPVEIPSPEDAQRFVGGFDTYYPVFRASKPLAQGVAVLDSIGYSYFRYQMHRAVQNVETVHAEVAAEFAEIFGRRYGPIEEYEMDDAEIVLVMAGCFATKGKAFVREARAAGRKVGLLRTRLVRPIPVSAYAKALAGRRAVGVIDQNISPGLGGILHHEIAGALAGTDAARCIRSFIGGLGGKDISHTEFAHVLDVLERAEPGAEPIESELLMTQAERQHMETNFALAGEGLGGVMRVKREHYKKPKDLPAEDFIHPGSSMCAGCGGLTTLRLMHKVLGENLVMVNAAGCMTLLANYPFTPMDSSWLYTTMGGAAAGAQGVRDALDVLAKKRGLPPEEDLHVVVLAGDGSASDIGLQSGSGAIHRRLNFWDLCYDNEAYGNTGFQMASTSPLGSHTTTADAVVQQKKDLFEIWRSQKPDYLATICSHDPVDLAEKIERARAFPGPKLFLSLATCPTGWGFDPKLSDAIAKLAIETGTWPLKEAVRGDVRHTYIPNKFKPVEDYLKPQRRFRHLFSPERDEATLERIQQNVDTYWASVDPQETKKEIGC